MKQNNIKAKIKDYFFLNPTAKLRVREIERVLKLPLPSVIRYCQDLEKESLLVSAIIGKVHFYTGSRSEQFLLEKRLYNLRQLYQSGLIDYLKIELSNPVIVLFGSYAKGEDMENSDIDLYVETPSQKSIHLEKFKKLLQREIQIFQHKNLKEVRNPHLANNIINGVVLNNYIEVFK